MNVVKSSFKTFVSNVGVSVVSFLAITVFARELTQSNLGTFFLFQAMLGFIAIPTDFGMLEAIEKRVSEGKSADSYLGSAVIFKGILLVLAVFAILLFRTEINEYLGYDFAIYLAAALVLQEFFKLGITVLNAEFRVGETATLKFGRQILWFAIGLALIRWGMGVVGLIFSLLFSLGLVGCWGWYKKSTGLGAPRKDLMRSLFDFSKYSFVLSSGGFIYNWTDVLVIGLFLSQSHVATYEIAWRVSLVLLLLSEAIATSIFPRISKLNADRAETDIKDLLSESITPSVVLVVPALFGTALLASEILTIIFGPEYSSGAVVLIILMINTGIQSVHAVLGKALPALNRPDLAARATISSVIVNGVFNILLVWKFGIIGAASATVLSAIVGGYLHIFYVRRLVSITIPYLELGWCAVSAVVMTAILVEVKSLITIDGLFTLLIFVSLGAVIYFIVLLMLPRIRNRFLQGFSALLAT